MPQYSYHGRDNLGQPVTGRRQAHSAEALAATLIHEGVTPIGIKHFQEKFSLQHWIAQLLQKKLAVEELRMFCRQMYTLTKAGIPIVSAVATPVL